MSVAVDVESKVVVVHGIHLIIEHGKPHVNADEQDAQLQHNTIRVTQHLDESVRTGELLERPTDAARFKGLGLTHHWTQQPTH